MAVGQPIIFGQFRGGATNGGWSADHLRAISWRNLHARYTVIDPILLRSDER
jgi:hypothetical protein